MKLLSDLEYLQAEAFDFALSFNPHAGGHETIAEYLNRDADNPDDEEDWISHEQREEAYRTGRFLIGTVYPNGSVSFYDVCGTNIADVVARCADLCRQDRARYQAHTPHAKESESRAFSPCSIR